MENTPFVSSTYENPKGIYEIFDCNGSYILYTHTKELAQFIVTACNEYEGLKKTVEQLENKNRLLITRRGQDEKLIIEISKESNDLNSQNTKLREALKEAREFCIARGIDINSDFFKRITALKEL